jgi:hypothetical protein
MALFDERSGDFWSPYYGASIDMDLEELLSQSAPVKRPRGRPRNARPPAEEAPATPPAASAGEEKKKAAPRKRGGRTKRTP